jgi:hypothetical protein
MKKNPETKGDKQMKVIEKSVRARHKNTDAKTRSQEQGIEAMRKRIAAETKKRSKPAKRRRPVL